MTPPLSREPYAPTKPGVSEASASPHALKTELTSQVSSSEPTSNASGINPCPSNLGSSNGSNQLLRHDLWPFLF
ncbi:hypothetical protein V6N13_138147 [Hibiscus sabdariffa]